MSIVEKIRNIQNSINKEDYSTDAWRHNEKMIKFLKNMGAYQEPSPKSYITEEYTPPALCNIPITFTGNSQSSFHRRIQ